MPGISDIPSHREIAEQCPSLVLAENTEEGWNRVIRGFAGKTPEERKRAGEANREAAERAFLSSAKDGAKDDQDA